MGRISSRVCEMIYFERMYIYHARIGKTLASSFRKFV